jgi:hypothetical protein
MSSKSAAAANTANAAANAKRKRSPPSKTTSRSDHDINNNNSTNNNNSNNNNRGSIGYVLECDAPVKQFVQYNDSTRHDDKKWIISDLDDTHLLIRKKYQTEIIKKVNEWMDSNVFSSVEKVGEDLDIS